MKVVGEVDPRFLSYNIETVEVTGGRFWKPYEAEGSAKTVRTASDSESKNQPVGMDPNLYQYRSPINLANPKLRHLAAALGPAYLRVSGTWRNTTQFQDSDAPAPSNAPEGYKGVMTRAQWKGVIDFGKAVDAELVTSVATSDGTRGKDGVWTPTEAKPFFEFTRRAGGRIAATEFMNEPTFASMGGTRPGYDAVAFGKDVAAFKLFLRAESLDTKFVGPGSVGEGAPLAMGMAMPKMISTEDMLKQTGPVFDIFSYHFYGSVSRRCIDPKLAITPEMVLTPAFFEKNLAVLAFYAKLRDEYDPGKPMWLTETGEAACGGDPVASSFVDSFRLMDQLGSLAQRSVRTVMLNTLAASDYGLLDEATLEPRPNFWAAVMWKRLMGTRAVDPGVAASDGFRVYGQCTAGQAGRVTIVAINFGKEEKSLTLGEAGKRYTLSSPDPLGKVVLLNGTKLVAGADGTVPAFAGEAVKAGVQRFAGMTITFLTMPGAKNAACQ